MVCETKLHKIKNAMTFHYILTICHQKMILLIFQWSFSAFATPKI